MSVTDSLTPSQRSPTGRGTSDPSTGLGLALVRELAELHGGQVGMDENPDGSSIFWFDLPRWSRVNTTETRMEKKSPGTRFFKLAELERCSKRTRREV